MGMICDEAGGRASYGKGDIRDITPTSLHQRSPIFMGSKDDVDDFDSIARK